MSNASSAASSSSAAGSQPAQIPSPVPTVSGEGRYGENITYPNGLKPNPYQLLHLFNTEQYDDQIRNAADQHNRLEPCVKSLFFLRSQQKLFERIIESCSLEIANQVMYACNYQLGLEGPITVPSTFPYHPHLSMPPPADPRALSEYPDPLTFSLLDHLGRRTDGNGYPRPDINDTRSLISRLTSEPRVDEPEPSSTTHTSPEFPDTLVYPDPTPTPDVKPKVKSIDSLTHSQSEPPTTDDPRIGGEAVPGESEGADEDDKGENRIPENVDDLLKVSLRSLTPAPTPMMQLIDRVSALCADWSAISPEIARSTCVVDASRLNLDIRLATALTNEDSLSDGHRYDDEQWDAQLLFVGSDPQKVRMLSVEERQAMGWQLNLDVPLTPRLETLDTMADMDDRPDTSYDYDTELYRDAIVSSSGYLVIYAIGLCLCTAVVHLNKILPIFKKLELP
uniref:Uncharacterized protein n=1 Tax=Moniliophthora roreri TaxID=221103 RepID=A0A0W0FT98_MONRR